MAITATQNVPSKIDPLTSLRFFAALAIVLGHTKAAFAATAWIEWFPYGYGVSCFFVLSGFILSYVYQEFNSRSDWIDFAVARVARIWPLHIVALMMFFVLIPKTQWFLGQASGHEISIVAANIFLVHAWIPLPAYFSSGDPVSSSISDELFFYLIFVPLRHKWSKTWHWKALLAVIGIALILTITTAKGVPNYYSEQPMSISAMGFGAYSPFVRIFDFMLGMLGASVFQWLNRRPLPGGVVLWTAIEIGSLFLPHVMRRYVQNLPIWIFGGDLEGSTWMWFMETAAAAPAFLVIILVLALNRGALSKLLSVKPLILLGEASFALYLTHLLFFMWLTAHRADLSFIPDTILCILYWSACIGASFLLWAFVEKPCRTKLRSWLRRTRAVSNQTISAV